MGLISVHATMDMQGGFGAQAAHSDEVRTALRKFARRVIPFLFVCYVAAWFDRVNVGFAALEMNRELHFSDRMFGIGSAIFFLGYCAFEVPSNLALVRFGARAWLARIMITWGVVAAAMAWMHTPGQFYTLRTLLGICEAGFFPGVIVYLSRWYPPVLRAGAIALFMAGVPMSQVLGGPIATALMRLDGWCGLSGWQWLYTIEGALPIALGIALWFFLPESPSDAKWLTVAEQRAIARTATEARNELSDGRVFSWRRTFTNETTWLIGLILLLCNLGFYSYTIWGPQLIKQLLQADITRVGLLSGVIGVGMSVAVAGAGWHSDRRGERRFHIAVPAAVMAVALVVCARSTGVTAVAALALVPWSMGALFGPCWAVSSNVGAGLSSAAGVALAGTLANAGGLIGPLVIGFARNDRGMYSGALEAVAACVGVACLLALRLPSQDGVEAKR